MALACTVQLPVGAQTPATQLPSVGGNLNVQIQGGDIIQSANSGAALSVTGTSHLNAGSGSVNLSNTPNQFTKEINLTASNVVLAATNGVILGSSHVTGNMMITAATGDIIQTAPLMVSGASSFNAAQGDVVLTQNNTLTQAVSIHAINTTLNTTSSLILGASTLTGNLVATVASGDITQTGPLVVTGTSTITAATGNITLTDEGNSFTDRVSVETPQALKLTASGALSMGEVNVGSTTDLQSHGQLDLGTNAIYNGKLTAKSGGFEIKQSGPLKAGKDVDFDAGSAKIDLFNPKNLWFGALFFKGGIIMINHPQLLNAVNSGVLMVRAENTVVTPVKAITMVASGSTATPPPVSGQASGAGADVSVAVASTPNNTQTGLVQVHVAPEAATPGKSFSFELDPHTVAGHAPESPVHIAQIDGKPIPSWLRFDPASKTFTANEVPSGAFPLQLKLSVGKTETVVVIQEKPPK